MTDGAQLYLVTPQTFEPEVFAEQLALVLRAVQVACVRLDLGDAVEETWTRAANHLIGPCHDADVPLVIAEHFRLVEPLGLDGVHLVGAKVRDARAALGPDRIVGAFAGTTRHQGLVLAEAGADYVSFGPVAVGGLGAGETVAENLFAWWSEMIETPVVAEGGVGAEQALKLRDQADFLVPDRSLWQGDDPVGALRGLMA